MEIKNKKIVFITGRVGVGKTTLIKEATLPYREHIGGFYTEEMKESGKRKGFLLKTFSGKSVTLASTEIKQGPKISKYRIDLSVLDTLACDEMSETQKKQKLLVVDEIGSMELLSSKFQETLIKCLSGSTRVLATIREKSQPFSDEIKKISDSYIMPLTRENFNSVKEALRKWIEETIKLEEKK